MAVRLASVMQAGHRLLPDVAALGEADGALVDSRLLGHRLGIHVIAEPWPPGLDANALGRLLRDGLDREVVAQLVRPRGRAEQVDAKVGSHPQPGPGVDE